MYKSYKLTFLSLGRTLKLPEIQQMITVSGSQVARNSTHAKLTGGTRQCTWPINHTKQGLNSNPVPFMTMQNADQLYTV